MVVGPDPYEANKLLHLNFNTGSGVNVFDISDYNRTVTETNFSGDEWDASSYNAQANYCVHIGNEQFSVELDGEDIDAHAWTIGFWVKFDSGSAGNEELWGLYDSTVINYGFKLDRSNDQKLWIQIDTDATTGWYSTDADPITWTDWNFIVVTWTGVVGVAPLMYINGSPVSLTEVQAPTGNVERDADAFDIGYTGGTYPLEGKIDDAFVYDVVLPADRISDLNENMPDMGEITDEYMDLMDPVLLMKEHLQSNFSQVPVEGPPSYFRGGYPATFGPPPNIVQIEGEEDQLRRGEIHLQNDPAKAIILLYEAAWTPTPGKDLRQDFRDVDVRVSIDIRTIIGRRALNSLFNEVKRIVYKIHRIKNETPSGNWSYVEPIQRLNLTNRSRGLWRITYDVRFVKVSEFSGDT